MRLAKRSIPDHLNIRGPSGRIDPVIAKALKSLETKKLKLWAAEDPANRGATLAEHQKALEDGLTKTAGTLRTATRRLRKEVVSDVERLLTANPILYGLTLRRAVDNYESVTATDPGVASVAGELAALRSDFDKRAQEIKRIDKAFKKSDAELKKKLDGIASKLKTGGRSGGSGPGGRTGGSRGTGTTGKGSRNTTNKGSKSTRGKRSSKGKGR